MHAWIRLNFVCEPYMLLELYWAIRTLMVCDAVAWGMFAVEIGIGLKTCRSVVWNICFRGLVNEVKKKQKTANERATTSTQVDIS